MTDTSPRAGGGRAVARYVTVGLIAAAGLFVYVDRGSQRLDRPGIWAEDGTRFIPDAYSSFFGHLFTPFDGYIQFIPRLLASMIAWFPITDFPALYTATSIVFGVGACALVLSPRMDRLLPSPIARAVAFLLLCALPGMTEVYGNVANLLFTLPVAGLVIALSRDPARRRWQVVEIVALFLLCISTPELTVLTPIFLLRLLRERTRHSAAIAATAVVGAAIEVVVYLNSYRGPTPNDGTLRQLARVTFGRWLGGWLFGDEFWGQQWARPHVRDLLIALALVLAVVALLQLRMRAVELGLSIVLPLAAATHAYGALLYTGGYSRHFVTPRAALVLLLVALAVASARQLAAHRRHVSIANVLAACSGLTAVGCLLLGLRGMHRDYDIGPIRQPDMQALADCVARAQDALCTVPSAPNGWHITIRP